MIHSPDLGDLFTAIAAFQSEVEAIPKDSTNPFFKSKYAALPDVVEAASPLLTKNGLAVTQLLGHGEQGDTLTTIVGHSSGQYIGDTMHLRPVKDDPQAQGSATTYGRRYAYMAALGLVADEDDDGNNASSGSRKPAAKKPAPKPAAKPAEKMAAKETTLGIDQGVVDELNALYIASGWRDPKHEQPHHKLQFHLLSLGVDDVDDVRAAIEGLTLEQALRLEEALKEGAADDAVPGSGETS